MFVFDEAYLRIFLEYSAHILFLLKGLSASNERWSFSEFEVGEKEKELNGLLREMSENSGRRHFTLKFYIFCVKYVAIF